MPDRGRHHQRSDAPAEYMSRDYSHRGQHYNNQRRSQNPRDEEERVTDRRTKESGKREVTSPSVYQGAGAYPYDIRPSTLPRETSIYHPEVNQQKHRQALYNLRYALTTRGICQLMEVALNLFIIICAGVPYSNNGGYRDLASFGGIYHYYFGGANAFTGADSNRVQELDRLFNQLKRPPYAFALACGVILMIYALVMFALGIFRVPYRRPPMLLVEAIVNFLISLGYVAGLVIYFVKIQETYQNPICQEREQMYKSKGHNGFECRFNGADIAGGLFGVAGIFVFIFGGVLAVRAYRSMQELKTGITNEDNHL
ncbi:PREDICTED: MARVEL domain-containing protein 3-like [Cyprinodon variegatus]|uniref:MARVEL domain containing 3 n=1 Tax=Cyprinodon variegatus TaxID=28743 RepID=A0A3Q2DKH0_CYPVA|nr:PREDICTED: MARVEL domain-containing protein 3-like [Cyprinodon variegatus]XP_015239694.1 PREDICTED: MARVEL domain-containing protein 3-like [Cyprinodon variegatus]